MHNVAENLPDVPRLFDINGNRYFALPDMEESQATELSDDLIFNWHELFPVSTPETN